MSNSVHRFIPTPAPKNLAEQVRALRSEARELAADHVWQLVRALNDVACLAGEIADGGDLYPVGARELSRRLTEDAGKQAMTLTVLQDRQP